MWKGSDIPTAEQGVRVLGTPLGHPDCVCTYLQNVLNEHGVLLSRILLAVALGGWTCQLLVGSCQARGGAEFRCGAHERIETPKHLCNLKNT